jgi:glycosyltransferase involved in cell wall biosynthesis
MRIAFVTPEFSEGENFSGGLANYVGRMSLALAGMGHQVEVFTCGKVDKTEEWHGVKVHTNSALLDPARRRWDRIDRLFQGQLYGPYQEAKRAWGLWRKYRQEVSYGQGGFDVVQVANVQGVGLFFKPLAGELLVTRHSNYRPLWDRSLGMPETLSQRLCWVLERWSVSRTAAHYAPSHFIADQVRREYGLAEVEVVETPFFQEVAEADPAFYRAHLEGKRYLLFFGRFSRMKGVHRLAEALPDVLGKHPNLHAVLIGSDAHLGLTEGSMRDYIRAAVGPQFQERLHLFEPLRHKQLYPVIEHAEWVVLPSVVDNLPNTCLEAMGHGRPVVATRGTCFEQIIEDGRTGVLCTADNAQDLAHGLNRALSMNPAARKAMGMCAKDSLQRLKPEQAVPALLEFYHARIDERNRRAEAAVVR